MIDALKRASAHRITAVLPYYGYARQDRKVQPRVPISAKLVADLLEAAGVDRVLALDLHAGQIQGFFNIPVDHLFAAPVIIDYLGKKDLQRPGDRVARRRRRRARARHRQAAEREPRHHRQAARQAGRGGGHAPHRRREGQGRRRHRRHDRHRRHARAGGRRARARRAPGASSPAASTPCSPGPAVERIKASPLEEVVVTNSIPVSAEQARRPASPCSRWRRCSARRSAASTTRNRSRRCSSSEGAETMKMQELTIKRREGTGKGRRPAAAPRRAWCPPSSTAARRRRRSPSIPRPCYASSTATRASPSC